MPIKWIGAVMIFLSGLLWGTAKASRLSTREKSLRDIRTALGMLESEIVFSSNYLKTALLNISRVCGSGEIFVDMSKQMEEQGVKRAWAEAIKRNQKKMALKNSDIEILTLLSSQLGMSDREHQVKNIRHVSALLLQACEDAKKEYEGSARLYRSMGIFAGLFLIILLI